MKKHIITLSFLLFGIFTLANNHKLIKEQQGQYSVTIFGISNLSPVLNSSEILTCQMDGMVNCSSNGEQFSWILKTIFLFGNGLNLAGFNVQMNKLNLKRGSGWVHKKECNLQADEINNGLSLRYRF